MIDLALAKRLQELGAWAERPQNVIDRDFEGKLWTSEGLFFPTLSDLLDALAAKGYTEGMYRQCQAGWRFFVRWPWPNGDRQGFQDERTAVEATLENSIARCFIAVLEAERATELLPTEEELA